MIVIIGGGISGLSLAYFLEKQGTPYLLIEKDKSPGGVIRSGSKEGFHFEYGPNSVLADDDIIQFFDEIGLGNEIIKASATSKKRFILKNGKITAIPSNPLSLLFSGFLSVKSKLSVLRDLRMKPMVQSYENECVYDTICRHFTPEIADYILTPFVSGIYAGDPKEIITSAAFPALTRFEKNYGSLLKGFVKGGTGRKTTISFSHGLQSLPRNLWELISHKKSHTAVESIEKSPGGYNLTLDNKSVHQATKLVISTDADAAAHLLHDVYPELSNLLTDINYTKMAVVHTSFNKNDVKNLPEGFGALHPAKENPFAAGTIWTSSVFPDKSPKDKVLFTSFVGGELFKEQIERNDDDILEKVSEEIQRHYKIEGKPERQQLYRWPRALPQYDRNILPILDKVEEIKKKNVYLHANWSSGISLGDRIKKSQELAKELKA